MKYFVLGALASGILLYGMSMIYGATGSLDISVVARELATGTGNRPILLFGLVFVVSGIAFKLGAVPYHMWVPDVYDGAPTFMTLLIGTAPKLAAFAFMLRLLGVALGGLWFDRRGSSCWLLHGVRQRRRDPQTTSYGCSRTVDRQHGLHADGFRGERTDGARCSRDRYVLTSLASRDDQPLSREGFEADRQDFKGLNQLAVVGVHDAVRSLSRCRDSADRGFTRSSP